MKLEEKLKNISGSSDNSGSFEKLKTDLEAFLSKGASGGALNEADRNFLNDLNNGTKGALQEIKMELMKASDESKFGESI